jgi:hypothetical protein
MMDPVDVSKEEFPVEDTMNGVVHHIRKDIAHEDLEPK